MNQNYDINEILEAFSDLENKNKKKILEPKEKKKDNDVSVIPKNTLQLIEEAEKTKS